MNFKSLFESSLLKEYPARNVWYHDDNGTMYANDGYVGVITKATGKRNGAVNTAYESHYSDSTDETVKKVLTEKLPAHGCYKYEVETGRLLQALKIAEVFDEESYDSVRLDFFEGILTVTKKCPLRGDTAISMPADGDGNFIMWARLSIMRKAVHVLRSNKKVTLRFDKPDDWFSISDEDGTIILIGSMSIGAINYHVEPVTRYFKRWQKPLPKRKFNKLYYRVGSITKLPRTGLYKFPVHDEFRKA